MATPILHFTSEPPLQLNCLEQRTVEFNLQPRLAGKCMVILTVEHPDCFFESGEKIFDFLLEANQADDRIDCQVPLRMKVNREDHYFILLSAYAVNEAGEKSRIKDIECEIDGSASPVEPPQEDPE